MTTDTTLTVTGDPVETLQLWGSAMLVRVPGENTGGAYSVLEYIAPPGAGSGCRAEGRGW